MLNAFSIDFGLSGADAEIQEERQHDAVAFPAVLGQLLAGLGEQDGTVGGARNPTLAFQPLEGLAGSDVGDPEAVGDIGETGVATLQLEIADELDVVLGPFAPMMLTGGLMPDRLGGCVPHGHSMRPIPGMRAGLI